MPTLPFTSAEIQAALEFVGISEGLNTVSKQTLVAAVNEILKKTTDNAKGIYDAKNEMGSLTGLNTTDKSSLVGAINELFQYAGDGKSAIAAAITGMGVIAAESETWTSLAEKITQIKTGITPLISNGGNVVPTGSYASSTYYNTDFGVLVSYSTDGKVIVTMKGGTSTAYENINFALGTAPGGVEIVTNSTSYDTADPAGNIYSCVLTGIESPVEMSIAMDGVNSTYDYVTCTITLTEV